MEKTDAAVAKIVEAINAVAMQHGAAGVDLTLVAIQTQAIFHLVTALVLIAAGTIFVLISKRLLAWMVPYGKQMDDDSFTQCAPMISAILFLVFGGITALTAFFSSIYHLLNATLWVSAIDPKVGLALRILDKVL